MLFAGERLITEDALKKFTNNNYHDLQHIFLFYLHFKNKNMGTCIKYEIYVVKYY